MRSKSGYTAAAIALHWVIAAAILANLALGWWMSSAIDSAQNRSGAIAAFQLHKSIGLSVLVLSLLRLAWRFLSPPPPLPDDMSARERAVSNTTHWLFYALTIGIPLSGWLYVSAQWRGDAPFNVPTLWFGLFEVPHLFALHQTAAELRGGAASIAVTAHEAMALLTVLLLALHVAAALWHQFGRRDGVLARMVPGLSTPAQPTPDSRTRRQIRRGRLAAVATLAIAAAFVLSATTTSLGPGTAAPVADMERALQQLIAADDSPAPAWQVLGNDSSIRFTGSHAGRPFKGRFRRWQAAIHFDPDQPGQSQIAAVVDTASATDGVPLHDSTLPQQEWFDSANHPHAIYRSTRVDHLGDNRYALAGTLTIKTHTVELAPFTLTLEGDALHIQGTTEIDRATVDMGMESDPQGQYVSRKIAIPVEVVAARR